MDGQITRKLWPGWKGYLVQTVLPKKKPPEPMMMAMIYYGLHPLLIPPPTRPYRLGLLGQATFQSGVCLCLMDTSLTLIKPFSINDVSTTEFYLSASLLIQHTFYNPWMSQCLVHLNEHIQICFRHSIPKENVGFGKATSTSFLTVRKRRPLQVPIFLVDFIILDCGL